MQKKQKDLQLGSASNFAIWDHHVLEAMNLKKRYTFCTSSYDQTLTIRTSDDQTLEEAKYAVERLREWIQLDMNDEKMRNATLQAGALLSTLDYGKATLGRLLAHWQTVCHLSPDDPDRRAFQDRVYRTIIVCADAFSDH